MEKINFINGMAPALSAANLNKLQKNVEDAINIIYESGSNENGRYIKFKDGTLICWKNITLDLDLTHAWGSMYQNTEAANLGYFAYTFIEPPTVNINLSYNNSGSAASIVSFKTSMTGIDMCYIVRPVSTSTKAYTFNIQAIGRWY